MYEKELLIGQLAVQRASIVSKLILKDYSKLYSDKTITKDDASPVTIADFAVQSAIISSITNHFPNDVFVAEESASDVAQRPDLLRLIENYINLADETFSTYNHYGYSFDKISQASQILASLSKGSFEGGRDKRFWILDPIDGTKGFLRNDQFALCLALMDENSIRVGVNGCPNLPVDIKNILQSHDFDKGNFNINNYLKEHQDLDRGLLFSALEGQGSYVSPLFKSVTELEKSERIWADNSLSSVAESVIVEGVETGHSNHGAQAKIKAALGIPEKRTVNLDSQCKYSLLAYGVANMYLRLPTNATYREKIWDHSSGYLLVKESGGITSAMDGEDLDFTKGRYLQSKGIISGSKQFHEKFIKAVQSTKM